MLPTLFGRIQTRILVLGVLGGLWALLLGPLLPDGAPLATTYRVEFTVLAVVILLGVVWEFGYHLLQQFRWEKDWPTLFGLLTGINEGVLAWLVVSYAGVLPAASQPTIGIFLTQFVTTWLLVWIVVNGPLRVVFPHWRFRGGRFV